MGLSPGGRRGVLVLLAARVCRLPRGESNARRGRAGGKEEEEMRIADILREEEDEQCCGDGGGGSGRRRRRRWGKRRKRGSPSSGSPRCLLSRWLPSRQFLCRACGDGYKDGVVEEVEEEESERGGEEGREISSVTSLWSAAAAGASSSADKEGECASTSEAMASSGDGEITLAGSEERKTSDTEGKPEQTSLNIGMGAGLLFLLTRSITEFNKMIELRKEMEGMLKEVKEEIQRKDAAPSSGESKNNLTFCGSNSWADTEQSNDLYLHDCNPCLELVEEASFFTEPDNRLKYDKFSEDANSPRIDEIEAELVSELELIQLNLEKQDSSEEPTAEFSGETTDPSARFSLSLGGQDNPQEWAEEQEEEEEDNDGDNTRDHYGVCPQELTRRLHELLETRQQERIAELESALELAHIKLREKEMEVSLWRDAAQLVSQDEEETLFK
ncbi:hypothetical protein Taro_029562 [Colocasia esculenta]|uniref:Protein POLAR LOCALIZATION DURING ASYMMETRIC DIVISION AND REDISTRIBUTION n=1 Tax=Colocasia esculenta TaxID=4460 RepID=A0A843W0M3_COLES|nr:hypothetical protein [Colocasia esculenta]